MRKGMLVVLVALLVVSGAALAQGEQPVFCGSLSEADCAVLEQARTAMQDVSAASFDLFVDIQAQSSGESVPVSIVGSGSFTGVLPHMGMDANNMGTTEDSIAALRDLNAALLLTITAPASEMDTPMALTLNLRLVDGVGYVNLDDLQPLFEDPSMTGWGGLDLAGLLGALLEQSPDLLAQMGQQLGGVDAGEFPAFNAQIREQYLTITRTDDGSGSSATFETTVDLAGLAADPEFGNALERMGSMGGLSSADPQQTQEQMRWMFENSALLLRQEIDTATGRTVSLSLELDANQSTVNSAEAGDSVSLTAMINFDYDNVPLVEAPADANILPYQQLLGMFGGMMSMSDLNRPAAPPTQLAPVLTPTATAAG
jgi:hypothetical protein